MGNLSGSTSWTRVAAATQLVHFGGRIVPSTLALGVILWLIPGIVYGLAILVRFFFIPAEIRDSGYFHYGILVLVALSTIVALGLPILVLYRVRAARAVLTAIAVLFTAALFMEPTTQALGAYAAVVAGTILMWLSPSNRYLDRRLFGGKTRL